MRKSERSKHSALKFLERFGVNQSKLNYIIVILKRNEIV